MMLCFKVEAETNPGSKVRIETAHISVHADHVNIVVAHMPKAIAQHMGKMPEVWQR